MKNTTESDQRDTTMNNTLPSKRLVAMLYMLLYIQFAVSLYYASKMGGLRHVFCPQSNDWLNHFRTYKHVGLERMAVV